MPQRCILEQCSCLHKLEQLKFSRQKLLGYMHCQLWTVVLVVASLFASVIAQGQEDAAAGTDCGGYQVSTIGFLATCTASWGKGLGRARLLTPDVVAAVAGHCYYKGCKTPGHGWDCPGWLCMQPRSLWWNLVATTFCACCCIFSCCT